MPWPESKYLKEREPGKGEEKELMFGCYFPRNY